MNIFENEMNHCMTYCPHISWIQKAIWDSYRCECLSIEDMHFTRKTAYCIIFMQVNPSTNSLHHRWMRAYQLSKTLKEFRTILKGQQLIVHTDHENLTYKKFNSRSHHAMETIHWRTQSRSEINQAWKEWHHRCIILSWYKNHSMEEAHFTKVLQAKLYCLDDNDLPKHAFPLSYGLLGKKQPQDKIILTELKKPKSHCTIQPFTGGGTTRDWFAITARLLCTRDYNHVL